jgi:hypothetical protein
MTTREARVLKPFEDHERGDLLIVVYDTTEQRTAVNNLIHQGVITFDMDLAIDRATPTRPPTEPGKP